MPPPLPPPDELSRHLAPADLDSATAALGKEPQRCPVCDARDFKRLFERDGKWFWRCTSCTLVFVHDIYPEFLMSAGLDALYSFERQAEAGERKRRKYDEFLGHLARLALPGRRLLEVGCGQGLFLEHARAAGYDVAGVEILAPVAARARARGLAILDGTLERAGFPDGAFDVVVLREVLEHIVDPVALLCEIRRVLAPGGVVALGTGNAGSWAARVRGARWAYYRFGGHMHIRFYSPESGAALARAAGFAQAECRTRGFALRENGELAGRWYRPLVKLAQAPLSPFAGWAGAGQRLVLLFTKGRA